MRPARTLLVAAFLAVLPALAVAQPGRGGPQGPRSSVEGPDPRGPAFDRPAVGGVTRLLNLRRVLDLTPRQVAQLDSIERTLVAERRPAMERLRAERQARGGRQARPLPPDSARARADRLRPQVEQFRRSDSIATAAAERLLTEAQRQRVRELRAYARGRMDGARRGGRRGAPRGARPGSSGQMGPMGAMGPMGPMGPRGAFRGPGRMRLDGMAMGRPRIDGMPLDAPEALRAPRPPRPPEG